MSSSRPVIASRASSRIWLLTASCSGTRRSASRRSERYEELGFNYFIIDYHWLDLDDATALSTLRLFGEQVMPAFR